jgi:site-specific recombinase XerD
MHDLLPSSQNRDYRNILAPLLTNSRLGAYAVFYLQAIQQESKSPKTHRIYSQVIRDFLKFDSDHIPTPMEVRTYLLGIAQRGCTPATVHVHYRTLKTWFKWLEGEKIIKNKQYPLANVKPPKIPEKIVYPFTKEEIVRILAVCNGDTFFDLRMRAAVLTFIDTGLRLFELANIQKNDINVFEGIIKVMGKGQKERYVKIGLSTRVAINHYLLRRTDQLPALWLTEERTPLTASAMQCAIFRITKLAGITDKRRGPHVFRHTSASLCKANGMDIYILQKMLGHTDIKTTERYLRSLGFDQLSEEHAKFSPCDNLFGTKHKPS